MPEPPSARFDLGRCTVTLLDAGGLRLDGGAMFGIIPKALWSRRTPADEQNRITLACNSLLVEWPGSPRRAIVEVGHGAKFDAKEQAIFAIDPARWLGATLAARGVDTASITDVVLTHLHFDHAGGLTHRDAPDAPLRAAFPNARVHVQRREFDDARANFGIMHATYREENFTPLDAADAWRLLDGEGEIAPDIRAILTPGHTRGHQSIKIDGGERQLIYSGDVMPTAQHLGAPYNMGYDLLPLDNRQSKRRVLDLAADRDVLMVIDHEPIAPVVNVRRAGDWFELTPAT